MSSPTSQVSLWGERRWAAAPRVGGSEAGRSEHPAAAQMCLFDLGAGKGASHVTVGPSTGLLPARASLQPCLHSRGPGSASGKTRVLPAWGGGQQSPEALLGVPWVSRLQQQMPSQPEGLGKEWQLRCRDWGSEAKREPLTAAY